MTTRRARAAVVHVNRTHPEGAPLRRPHIDGAWPLRQETDAAIDEYLEPLDTLVAVAYRGPRRARELTVVDVRMIAGHHLDAEGKVVFHTAPAPHLEGLLGRPSPVRWSRGDGWPIKTLDLAASGGDAA